MELTDYASEHVQIFELWERADMSGDKPCYYVKCIYNKEDLLLAHHSNGQAPESQHIAPPRLPHSCLFSDLPSCLLVPSYVLRAMHIPHLKCWTSGILHLLLWSMSVALQVSLCCWRSSGIST